VLADTLHWLPTEAHIPVTKLYKETLSLTNQTVPEHYKQELVDRYSTLVAQLDHLPLQNKKQENELKVLFGIIHFIISTLPVLKDRQQVLSQQSMRGFETPIEASSL